MPTMQTCGNIKIVQRRSAALRPFERNSRTHSEAQIAQIAASVVEFGWTNPILIDGTGGVIAGHGRLLAAQKLGMAKVPCIVLDHLTETQRRALVIADNKLGLNAGWDEDLLAAELAALLEGGFDTSAMGFDEAELAALLADKTDGLTDPDDVPDAPADPVTRLGDVWLLGAHRLVCGDATDADTVAMCFNGVRPHLMVTDPPYGVEYDANWRNDRIRSDGSAIAGRAVGKVSNDDEADWRGAWALFPGDVAYTWCASLFVDQTAESLRAAKFELRSLIIWTKQQFAIGRSDYHWQHEPCWYAVRKGKAGHWNGGRKQSTVWEIDKPHRSETGHSTQKPVECMKRPIENNSRAGQSVYDPFVGSGTTIIAGEMTGRTILAIELSPAYVDVSIIRWQDFTGKQARHADGHLFDDMRAERDLKVAA